MTKPFLLPLNLQFFAEGEGETTATNANSSEATVNTDNGGSNKDTSAPAQPQQSDVMIPKHRFDEVNNKYKEVKAQLDAILAQQAEAERKAQEEQGKFKELYEQTTNELTSFKSKFEQIEARAKQLESVIQSLLETKLNAIDEQYHDLIPDNLTPEEKLAWIDKAEQKGLFKKKGQTPIGEGTNPSQAQAIDLNSLSPIQLLKAGYGSK
jgi:DNA repair exonuclease SbcCD ATPase subunit